MPIWSYEDDRTYHGITDDETGSSLIEIELAEFGPTERTGVYVLRTMRSSEAVGSNSFGWGYNGGGTSAAAQEILADALGEAPSWELREDFCEDVLSQMTDEWRLRRGAILRWVRGWYAVRPNEVLPVMIEQLPPVDRRGYGRRPTSISDKQKRRIYGKNYRP